MPAIQDYTLSASHFNRPPVSIFAEYNDRPSEGIEYQMMMRLRQVNSCVSYVYMFTENLFGSLSDTHATWMNDGASFSTIQHQQSVEKIKLSAIWKQHVSDVTASTDVDTLSETIENVFELMSRFGPSAISLTDITANRLNGEHLAAVLRLTFHYRSEVAGWDNALNMAIEVMKETGIDYEDALTGLV
ncbi:MAG: hypothetical protein V4447_00205 [Pseudomonadota bacterium]